MAPINNTTSNKILLAFVGMPGAGKSQAALYLKDKGIPFIRFGDLTDECLKEKGLPQTPENEESFRINIRKELGMAAYAIKAKPKIDALLGSSSCIAIDGLYSWEEFKYLKDAYPGLCIIHVYAEPKIRYERLSNREIRPFTNLQAQMRDISEIENINKAGPIAMADFIIQNNSNDLNILHSEIDKLISHLQIKL